MSHHIILKNFPTQLDWTCQPDSMSPYLSQVIIPVNLSSFSISLIRSLEMEWESPEVCAISNQWRAFPQPDGEASKGWEMNL